MEKQFVTFEIAKILKALCYNESCMAAFTARGKFKLFPYNVDANWNGNNIEGNPYVISAPLWQQVEEWLREKYDMDVLIERVYLESGEMIYSYTLEYLPKMYKNSKEPEGKLERIHAGKEISKDLYEVIGWEKYYQAHQTAILRAVHTIESWKKIKE